MRRTIVLIGVGLLLVVGILAWRAARPARSPDATVEEAAALPSSPDAPPSAARSPTASAVAADRMRRNMEEISRAYQPPRDIVPSGPEQRRGESQYDYTMRRRALADYQQFLSMGAVSPEHDQAIRRLIADAQDNWQVALKATGRKQPEPTFNIMMDPVLGPVLQTIETDFRRDARTVLGDGQASMLNSMVPSLLPYIETRAFQTR